MQGDRERARCALVLLALLASLASWGCAGSTQNVRALRAYAYETPDLVVATSRVEDLDATLALIDELLFETPYSPGAKWVQELPLDARKAAKIRRKLRTRRPYRNHEFEVPIVTIYRVHLEQVLARAKAEIDSEDAQYKSLFDGLVAVDSRLGVIRSEWQSYRVKQVSLVQAEAQVAAAHEEYRERTGQGVNPFTPRDKWPPKIREAEEQREKLQAQVDADEQKLAAVAEGLSSKRPSDAEQKKIVSDGTVALSVVNRVELEALALVPIVTVQVVRSLPKVAKKPGRTLAVAEDIPELPGRVAQISERLKRQLAVVEPLGESLAQMGGKPLDETVGFEWKESVVDQIAGITLDSFRVQLSAGAEAFFYSGIGANEKSENPNGKVSYDYSGRTRRLRYNVEPILLANAQLQARFDYLKLPDAVGLDFGFATDRAFSSGGNIEQGNIGDELGAEGVASDAINAGLAIVGITTRVRIASFNAGEVELIDTTAGGNVIGRAPLTFKLTQIDAGYDLSFLMGEDAGKYYLETLTVGVRYFDYDLPRVLYEFEDTNPAEDRANYVILRESPPQFVESNYFMAGAVTRFGPGDSEALAPFFDLSLFIGGGPTSYYFLVDESQPDVEGNRDEQDTTAVAVDLGMGLGVRWRVFRSGSRLRAYLNAAYNAEFVASQLTVATSENENDRVIDFGGADLFHGPVATFSGTF